MHFAQSSSEHKWGMILPQVITMGTVTKRVSTCTPLAITPKMVFLPIVPASLWFCEMCDLASVKEFRRA